MQTQFGQYVFINPSFHSMKLFYLKYIWILLKILTLTDKSSVWFKIVCIIFCESMTGLKSPVIICELDISIQKIAGFKLARFSYFNNKEGDSKFANFSAEHTLKLQIKSQI